MRLVLFFLIQAYVSWNWLHSVSNWSYWSRTLNPSMARVAGAWKGRESGCFGASPLRFFRASNPLSLVYCGVFWWGSSRLSVHGRRPINRLYSLVSGNNQSGIYVLHCTCSRYWSRRNHLNCRSVIELNRTQSFDWVRLSSVIEHSPTKKTRESSISALNRSNRT